MIASGIGLSEIDRNYLDARRRSARGWYAPRLNLIYVESADAVLLNHELNHFIVHMATPYGTLFKGLNALADRLVLDYCKWMRRAAPDEAIVAPIYKFASKVRAADILGIAPEPFLSSVDRYISPWSSLIALGSIFEGGLSRAACRPKMMEAIKLLATFERLWYGRAGRSNSAPALQIPVNDFCDGTACPLSPLPDGRWVGVGARHLIEGIATCVESEGGFLHDESEAIEDFVEYRLFWGWYIPLLLRAGVCDRERAIATRNTFMVLANLALFIPAGPYFCELRREGHSWRDIHPGWRFLKAATGSIELGLIDDLQRDGLAFADEVCRKCGWPTVSDFFDHATALPDENGLADATRLAFAHQKAAQARDFDAVAVAGLWDRYMQAYGPAIWVEDAGQFVCALDTAERNALAINLFISRWCDTVMVTGQPTPNRVFALGLPLGELFYRTGLSNEELFRLYIERNGWMDPAFYLDMAFFPPRPGQPIPFPDRSL